MWVTTAVGALSGEILVRWLRGVNFKLNLMPLTRNVPHKLSGYLGIIFQFVLKGEPVWEVGC